MEKIPTGVPGLDKILKGGLRKGWTYLVKGTPGSGKTILGLQFLMEGVKRGEKCAYISFDETYEEVKLQAESFGWSLDGIYFIDKVGDLDIVSGNILFYDFDTTAEITSFVESITQLKELENVDRVFIDGIGALRDVAKDPTISRRILVSITCFLNSIKATTIVSSDMSTEFGKELISYITSGEIALERIERDDGEVLRVMHVLKYRGGDAHLGRHYFRITSNGIVVYPIIPLLSKKTTSKRNLLSTGSEELDLMLGGGIYEGASVIIAGKSGVGKTNLCLQILKENDMRNDVGILYTFDETEEIIMDRLSKLFDYKPKNLIIRELRTDMSLGEFYTKIMDDISKYDPKIVVIDPINNLSSIALTTEELSKVLRLMKSQLRDAGIVFICVDEITEALGVFRLTGFGISPYADYLILGRFMEIEGELVKTISVVKNRFGNHERTIRVLDIKEKEGLKISKPLKEYTGIMSGVMTKSK
jgi:circadian clock protein KaiC